MRKAFEVKHPVDIERLRIFMTQSGFVALDCEDMSAEENARLFGDDGVCEPVALHALVSEMLAIHFAAPGEADMAVHSMKDVPAELPPGFALPTVLAPGSPLDAFVSNHYDTLESLPDGARVGTSSLRRAAMIKHLRPDLEILSLRGNVQTRLAKLDAGEILVRRGKEDEMLAVGSGFIEVYGDKVSILTDQAINVEEIDDSEIEDAVRRAQEALEEGKKSNLEAAEIDRLEAQTRFALAQQIARGKRR